MHVVRLLRVAVVGHGLLISSVLVAGLIPFALPVWLLAMLMAGTGMGEAAAARILGRGRRPTPAEAEVLEPVLTRLEAAGLGGGRLRIVHSGVVCGADWLGRSTLLIDRVLLDALCQGRISVETAASVLGHAAARRRAARAPFDIPVRVGTLPLTLLRALGRRVWVLSALWQLRGVTAILMLLVAAFAPPDPNADPYTRHLVVGMAVYFLLRYLPPRADRAWNRLVERTGDPVLARHGLGDAYARLLEASGTDPDLIDRVHALRQSTPTAAVDVAGHHRRQMLRGPPPVDYSWGKG